MVGDEDVLKHKHAVETCGLVSIAVIDFGHKICALDFGAFHRSKSGKSGQAMNVLPDVAVYFQFHSGGLYPLPDSMLAKTLLL